MAGCFRFLERENMYRKIFPPDSEKLFGRTCAGIFAFERENMYKLFENGRQENPLDYRKVYHVSTFAFRWW